MQPQEVEVFRRGFVEAWALDISRVEDLSLDDARREAERRVGTELDGAVEGPEHQLFVVTDGEVPVGTLWYSVRGRRAFVEDITISAEHRGRGYGRRALELMHVALRQQGVEIVQLNVYAHNPRAQALYEELGYGATGVTMTKRLRVGEVSAR